MALITPQEILNGSRNLVVKLSIADNAGGDASESSVIVPSLYTPPSSDIKIMKVISSLSGFSVLLSWDATTNVDALALSEGDSELCYEESGGLINNAGAGKTGNILLTTNGIAAGDYGTIVLYMKKKN